MTNLKESKLPKGLKWTDNCVIIRQEKIWLIQLFSSILMEMIYISKDCT